VNLQIRILPEAERQAVELHHWWRKNRPAASVSIYDELQRIYARLIESPNFGMPYKRRGMSGVRRYRLKKTPYHVYYFIDEAVSEVVVMAVWSAMRRQGPPLRTP